MKNNPLALMLIAILLISTLVNSWLAYSYNSSIKKFRDAQRDPEVAKVQRNRAGLQVFIADLVDYSKTHPNINPLLQSIGMGGGGAPVAPAPAPAPGKPATSTTKPGGK